MPRSRSFTVFLHWLGDLPQLVPTEEKSTANEVLNSRTWIPSWAHATVSCATQHRRKKVPQDHAICNYSAHKRGTTTCKNTEGPFETPRLPAVSPIFIFTSVLGNKYNTPESSETLSTLHFEHISFLVTLTTSQRIILGYPCLWNHNPKFPGGIVMLWNGQSFVSKTVFTFLIFPLHPRVLKAQNPNSQYTSLKHTMNLWMSSVKSNPRACHYIGPMIAP